LTHTGFSQPAAPLNADYYYSSNYLNQDIRLFTYDYLARIIRVDIICGGRTGVMSIMYAADGSDDKVLLPDGTLCNCVGHPVRWENGYLLNVPDGGPDL